MTLPNFLIIGAAKSGTTSLHYYLGQHPEIFMCLRKDTFFFDFDGEIPHYGGPSDDEWYRDRAVARLSEYEALFAGASGRKAVGEACAGYLYDPLAPARIHRTIPDAKLIAVLRDPVERGYSSFLQQVRDGYETETDYAAALALEDARVRENWRPIWHYKRRGLYAEQVRRYLERFGASRVRVHLYDELQRDPAGLLAQIFAFLEVDCGFAPDTSVVHNRAGIPRSRTLHRLTTSANPLKAVVLPFVPRRLRQRFRSAVAEGSVNLRRPPLPPELRRRLVGEYRSDILALQDLIRRDLSHWLA